MYTSGFGGMTQSQISIGKRSEALREAVGLSWSPTERLLHESQLIAARSRLNEQTWEAAFAEGQAMTLKDAVEYALAEDGHDPRPRPPCPSAHLLSNRWATSPAESRR
jgi:hypothetical protein